MNNKELRVNIDKHYKTHKEFLSDLKKETGVSIDPSTLSHILRGRHEMTKAWKIAMVLFFKGKVDYHYKAKAENNKLKNKT